MSALGKYWKVILAFLLVLVAAFFYFNKYKIEKLEYESKTMQMENMIVALKQNIQENLKYADIQDELDDAKAEIEASRQELYKSFPVELREEDQIMYVLYLETVFKEEIFFTFSQPGHLVQLNDGSSLQGLEIVVNYETTYQGFQDMIDYLATDSRVASVQEATIEYDAENDIARGYVMLRLYLITSKDLAAGYLPPDVAIPETGKENIFE